MDSAADKRPTRAKPRGRPFVKGTVANPKGCPKGSRNKRTIEGIAFFADILHSAEWQSSARQRMVAGDAPHLEKYAVEITWGKPRESVHLDVATRDDEERLRTTIAAKLNAVIASVPLVRRPLVGALLTHGGEPAHRHRSAPPCPPGVPGDGEA